MYSTFTQQNFPIHPPMSQPFTSPARPTVAELKRKKKRARKEYPPASPHMPPLESVELDRLCYAAMKGNLESLQDIIAKDNSVLDGVVAGIVKGKNPLHVAITAGQTQVVQTLLAIKKDLATILDTELRAALQVATAKGHVEIVKALVKDSPELSLACDLDGNNLLHIAAIKGQVHVLQELVRLSPPILALVKTDRGDTIFHLCVKYDRFHCLQELVRLIPDPNFVNAADADGNTILHLAVFEKQVQSIQMIIKVLNSDSQIGVNAMNKSGQTALDILLGGRNQTGSEIYSILVDAGAKRAKQIIAEDHEQTNNAEGEPEDEPKFKSERRNTLLIAASLIATVTFQCGVTPPGGAFPDNSDGQIGLAILAHTHPYWYYTVMIANTSAFLGSLSTIVLLILALPEQNRDHQRIRNAITLYTIVAIVTTYVASVTGITPKQTHRVDFIIFGACLLWAVASAFLSMAISSSDGWMQWWHVGFPRFWMRRNHQRVHEV